MKNAIIAAGLTLALGAIFSLTSGSRRTAATPYVSMEGKTIMTKEAAPPTAPPAAPMMNIGEPKAAPAASTKPKAKFRLKRKPAGKTKAPPPLEIQAAAPVLRDAVAQPAPVAPPPINRPANPGQDYTFETITDKFENDPSNYPLDRTGKMDGITLGLLGLERMDTAFILKVAITNESEADFFVKDFTIHANRQYLASRAFFRILIEPQRTREGYVVFAFPPPGTDVHVILREDDGKGRRIELKIPYPF